MFRLEHFAVGFSMLDDAIHVVGDWGEGRRSVIMGARSGRLVFVGAVTVDVIALVSHYPGPDERVVVQDLVRAGGGPAATAAIAAARAGHDTALVAAVGDDDEATEILDELRAEGVDVTGVVQEPGTRSASTLVTVATDPPTRAMCSRPGPSLVGAAPRLVQAMSGASWVHVDHHGWPLVAEVWPRLGPRPQLSVDDGHVLGDLNLDLGLVDLYVPTLAVLRRRAGRDDMADALDWALAANCGAVVATDGGAGSYGQRVGGQLFHEPAVSVDTVSTLGAGDVFHGALVAALADGLELPAAVRRANTTAARSCTALDGRTAIPRSPDHDRSDFTLEGAR